MKGTYPFIPEEMVVHTLQNLPTNSLLRFKCVSKQWHRLICKIKTQRQKLVMKSESVEGDYSVQSIDQATCQVQIMDIPWKSEQAEVHCYGSCNGLLLVEFMDDLFLWNPLIRYHQKVLSYKGLSDYEKVAGLCFDSIRNEYTIIMHLSDHRIKFAMVGSPRNKSWTRIYFPYKGYSVRSGPVLNNHLHWIASKKVDPELIIYFDTKVDGFLELPLPLPQEGEPYIIVGLGVLDGCLCMSRSKRRFDDILQVMAMKEYGVRESWTTLYTVEGIFFKYEFKPFFYLDETKSEVLMKADQDSSDCIFVYNVNTKSRRDVTTVYYMQYETVYEETIDRPSQYDWEELGSRNEASYVEKFPSGYFRTIKKDENGSWRVDTEEGRRTSEEKSEDEDEESDDGEESEAD